MTVFSLLAVGLLLKFALVLFIISATLLILIILVQKGKGGGLSGAFGGGMAGGVLGSKTGDFLTWVTIGLVGLFLFLAVIMAKYYKPGVSTDLDVDPAISVSAPAETGAPAVELPAAANSVDG